MPVAAVAEWYRHWIVAGFVTSSSPVPLKTRRVGQRCTLNLSRAEKSSRCYTRAFGDGSRYFEPWSSDKDDTRGGTTFPNNHTTPTGGRLSSPQIYRAFLPYRAGVQRH
ncbi:hypothetical protein TNCV_2662531 [Trichonephila clavipes]|nr:hypothetical protein TNCV_2662531 [Trichonephila clavipes]